MSTNKTKVALVTTPLLQKRGNHPLFPPLGLAYMAAVLEQNGFEVKIIDCPVCELDHEKLKAELSSFQPTIVGIGSMTPTIESALKSARVTKEVCPNAKVLMGGPHATFSGEEILTSEKAVDIIVRGEGEETIVEASQTSAHWRHQRNSLPKRQPNNPNSKQTLHPRPRCTAASSLQTASNGKIQYYRKEPAFNN